MSKEIMVTVTSPAGKTKEVSIANSFDLINNCGWNAAPPKAVEPSQADIDAAQALIAAASDAKAEGESLKAAMESNKDDNAVVAPTGDEVDDKPAADETPADKPKGRGRTASKS